MNPVQIRAAEPSDAEAIIHVHHAAVHQTAFGFYPVEILEVWSASPGERRYEWMRNLISKGEETVVVGQVESCVLGFGIFFREMEELRALYVHPDAGRRGIGKQILLVLETQAAAYGISRIQLNASLNAEPFYRANGYASLSPGKFRLSAGVEMDCVKMEKRLSR